MSVFLEQLYTQMASSGVDLYIDIGSDPHNSEYVSSAYRTYSAASGFTGSAAKLALLGRTAFLFVDGRYHIQAENQLAGTGIHVMKEGAAGVPGFFEWLEKAAPVGVRVGFCGNTMPYTFAAKLMNALKAKNPRYITKFDLIGAVWSNRPAVAFGGINMCSKTLSGSDDISVKYGRLKERMAGNGAEVYISSSLDGNSWFLNLRGSDIECNPVFFSGLIISNKEIKAYLHRVSLSAEAAAYLRAQNVKVMDYPKFKEDVKKYCRGKTAMFDPASLSYDLVGFIEENASGTVRTKDLLSLMKLIKSASEIEAMKAACLNEGAALCTLLYMQERNFTGEIGVVRMMEKIRSSVTGYRGPSFATIAAAGKNSAVVHYDPSEDKAEGAAGVIPSNKPNASVVRGEISRSDGFTVMPPQFSADIPEDRIAPDIMLHGTSDRVNQGMLLIDTGGQYDFGTTDITRTVPMDEIDDLMKFRYTMVLKSHIAAASLRFPDKTPANCIDAVARAPMWRENMDYMHGTGHGVGAGLCVHEGPVSINKSCQFPMAADMVETIEPGFYVENEYGIRLENMYLVVQDGGGYLKFEPLTYCPFDSRLVKTSLLEEREIKWLKEYNAKTLEKLEPLLVAEVYQWARERSEI